MYILIHCFMDLNSALKKFEVTLIFFTLPSFLHVSGFFPHWMFEKKISFLWNSVTGLELCFSFNNSTFLRTQGSLSVCKISSSLFSDKFSAIIYLNCFSVPFDFLLLRNLFCLCWIFFVQCFYLYFLQLFIQFLFSFEFTGILSSMSYMSKFQFSAGFSLFFIDWLNKLAL